MSFHRRRPATESNVTVPVEWRWVGEPIDGDEARRIVDRSLPLRSVTELRNVADAPTDTLGSRVLPARPQEGV